MAKIKILVADTNYLMRKGMEALLASNSDFDVVAEACTWRETNEKIKIYRPDVLIIDHISVCGKVDTIKQFLAKNKEMGILAITNMQPRNIFLKSLDAGIISYLLKECDKDEINEAVYKTAEGKKFLCGKVLDVMMSEGKEEQMAPSYASCEGVVFTDREIQIITLVAEGYANKQIADKLFLSNHTVTTHRKNIMNKLGVPNTAGLVMYAVRNNLISPNKYLFSSVN